GRKSKSASQWAVPVVVDLKPMLAVGKNVIAIEVGNDTETESGETNKPNPAGLVFHGLFRQQKNENGKITSYEAELTSDASWLCNEKRQQDWEKTSFKDEAW